MINLDNFPSFFIANWKLNGNFAFLKDYFTKLKSGSKNAIVICTPDIYLNFQEKKSENIFCGAQDVSKFDEGAYTGETSVNMLVDVGIDFCLVGHSERRQYFNESNEAIKIKSTNLINENIIPVICIGESLEEKKTDKTKEILKKQIENCIPEISNHQNTIIAYEPIWAIGTGLTPSISEIDEVHQYIKNINDKFMNFKVIYGGSVNSSNSANINNLNNVDGCLIGGSSLKVDEFNRIIS